jgi:hypothetical protein
VGLVFPVRTFDASVTHGFQRDDLSFATAGEAIVHVLVSNFNAGSTWVDGVAVFSVLTSRGFRTVLLSGDVASFGTRQLRGEKYSITK